MTPDVWFLVFALVRHVRQTFWCTYVIMYCDFIVIVESWAIICLKKIADTSFKLDLLKERFAMKFKRSAKRLQQV